MALRDTHAAFKSDSRGVQRILVTYIADMVCENTREIQMKWHTNGKTRWFIICTLRPIWELATIFENPRFVTGWIQCTLLLNRRVHFSFTLNAENFKYLGTTRTNQNDIYKEINSVLNSANAWYRSVQSLLISRLPQIRSRLKYTELFTEW